MKILAIAFNLVVGTFAVLYSIYVYDFTVVKEIFTMSALIVSYANTAIPKLRHRSAIVQVASFIGYIVIFMLLRLSFIGL
jgi:hypothetical protein